MKGRYFLDTNLFIYAIEGKPEAKAAIAQTLIEAGIKTKLGVISFQVAQETLNVVTRKARIALSLDDAQLILRDALAPLCQIFPSIDILQNGLQLQERYRYGFYDSMIVAAALEAKCELLYSEDLRHGQQIDGLTIKNPFEKATA